MRSQTPYSPRLCSFHLLKLNSASHHLEGHIQIIFRSFLFVNFRYFDKGQLPQGLPLAAHSNTFAVNVSGNIFTLPCIANIPYTISCQIKSHRPNTTQSHIRPTLDASPYCLCMLFPTFDPSYSYIISSILLFFVVPFSITRSSLPIYRSSPIEIVHTFPRSPLSSLVLLACGMFTRHFEHVSEQSTFCSPYFAIAVPQATINSYFNYHTNNPMSLVRRVG